MFPKFCCFDTVHQYYLSASPTNKAAISLLDVELKSNAERDCLRFLQQYLSGLDQPQLIKCLRFTTGSDIIAVDKITADFIGLLIKRAHWTQNCVFFVQSFSLELLIGSSDLRISDFRRIKDFI